MMKKLLGLAALGIWAVNAALLAGCGAGETPTPQVTPMQKCITDLIAEHARWVKDPSKEINPASCNQPAVSYSDYVAAWKIAGGEVWVADE